MARGVAGARGRVVDMIQYRRFRRRAARPLRTVDAHETISAPAFARFAGGVFNPGAAMVGDRIVLLGRGESSVFHPGRLEMEHLLTSPMPVVVDLALDMTVTDVRVDPQGVIGRPEHGRLEDFRLFEYRGRNLVSHTILDLDALDRSVRIVAGHQLNARIGLSQLDAESGAVTYLGQPTVDFALARQEKNWGFFERDGDLFLVYRFHPLRVLKLVDLETLRFETVVAGERVLPVWLTRGFVHNSVNPIPYDATHLLGMVHRKLTTSEFIYWPILVDTGTLRPTKILSRPLIASPPGATPESLAYVSSLLAVDDGIVFFMGIGDRELGHMSVRRTEIDPFWCDLRPPGGRAR